MSDKTYKLIKETSCPTTKFEFKADEAYLLAAWECMNEKIKENVLPEDEAREMRAAMRQIEFILA